jgi:hypothetical protein
MAYNFLVEKLGEHKLLIVHQRLMEFRLIEFFPVEISLDSLALGISVPLKYVNDPHFSRQLETAMTYLIAEEGFLVTDLYTGKSITATEIAGLAARIAA